MASQIGSNLFTLLVTANGVTSVLHDNWNVQVVDTLTPATHVPDPLPVADAVNHAPTFFNCVNATYY